MVIELKWRIPDEGLYILAVKRIYSLKKTNDPNEIIPIKEVMLKLCRSFQICKTRCYNLLFMLHDFALIKIIYGHGVKLNYEIIEKEIKIITE